VNRRCVFQLTMGSNSTKKYSQLLAEHGGVEAFNLLGGTDAQGRALVDGVDLYVQNGAAGDAVRRLTARLFDEQTERSGFEREAKLGRGRLGRRVGEHTLVLRELLVHVRDQAARVTQRVAVIHVVIEQVLVTLGVLRGAHVGRGEDLGRFVDRNLRAGANPRFKGTVRKLATLRRATIGEFIDAVVEGDNDSRTRAVKRDERRALVATGGTDQTIRASARSGVPDTNNRTDSPVVVDDGGAVERVPAHRVLTLRVALHDDRFFFRRAIGNRLGRLDAIPHQVIRDDIDGQLRVTKRVGRTFHGDERRAQRFGDIRAALEHFNDNLAQLFICAVAFQNVLKARVRILLLGRGVEGRARRAVLVRANVAGHAAHRSARLARLTRRARRSARTRNRGANLYNPKENNTHASVSPPRVSSPALARRQSHAQTRSLTHARSARARARPMRAIARNRAAPESPSARSPNAKASLARHRTMEIADISSGVGR